MFKNSALFMVALCLVLVGCKKSNTSDEVRNVGDPGLTTQEIQALPEGVPSQTSMERVIGDPQLQLTREQENEAAKIRKEARRCTDSNGLYNFELGECFSKGEAENRNQENIQLEVSDVDNAKDKEQKECVNSGGTYNYEFGDCFKDS